MEAGNRLGLGLKPQYLTLRRLAAWSEHLQRHDSAKSAVPCLVNDTHSTFAKQLQYFVVRGFRPGVPDMCWIVCLRIHVHQTRGLDQERVMNGTVHLEMDFEFLAKM